MKKFLKIIVLFLLIFLIFLYFVGSCTERPETYTSKNESSLTDVEILTPEEYQKSMDELINNPPITQTVFKSPFLQAHAESTKVEEYVKYLKDTVFYDIDDFVDDWFVGYNDLKDYFSGNESYPVSPVEPKESITAPFEYKFYGKNRVVYKSGAYEIITCDIITTGKVADKSKTGAVKYTRTNNLNQSTQFGFAISVFDIVKHFSSTNGFVVNFYGLDSYTFGLTSNFTDNYLASRHRAYFLGSSVNSLKQYNISSNNSVTIDKICYDNSSDSLPNHFSIGSVVSNDYEFSQSVNNYFVDLNYWKLPNVYYNNRAGDTITKNNISNYNEYGYTYNSVTNSIEFDPDVYADFFDLNIKPKLEAEYDLIFSKFPDIDAKFDDIDVKYNNLIDIMNEIKNPPSTTTTGTYPVGTGNCGCDCDINVTVDVTFPPEYYKTYPPLNTEPAFVAENPDVDFALDSPLPVRVLETSGGFISLASDFLDDAGLKPVVLMGVALGLITLFFL